MFILKKGYPRLGKVLPEPTKYYKLFFENSIFDKIS